MQRQLLRLPAIDQRQIRMGLTGAVYEERRNRLSEEARSSVAVALVDGYKEHMQDIAVLIGAIYKQAP